MDLVEFVWNNITSLGSLPINQLLLTFIVIGVLALIGTLTISHFFLDKWILKKELRWKGITLYRNPTELDTMSPLFLNAKSHVIILAIDGGLFTKRFYAQILDMCTKGKVLQFLFLDENSELLDRIGDCWSLAGNPHKVLAESLERLCHIKKELSTTSRPNLQIRFYDLLPIHSMTIIDPESEDGLMQVTIHRYGTHDWSFLRISKREQPELFEKYLKSYRFAEGKAREYQCQ